MPLLTRPSPAAFMSLLYITLGALIDVWTVIWFWFLRDHQPESSSPWYWCAGLFFTGLVLMVIGFGVGQIGRSARHAELPPPEVTPPKPLASTYAVMPQAPGMQPIIAAPPGAVQQPTAIAAAPVAQPVPQVPPVPQKARV